MLAVVMRHAKLQNLQKFMHSDQISLWKVHGCFNLLEINDYWVIPCQINKEFRVTSRILSKLDVFVVLMVLITHANF